MFTREVSILAYYNILFANKYVGLVREVEKPFLINALVIPDGVLALDFKNFVNCVVSLSSNKANVYIRIFLIDSWSDIFI